ncbi:MAG: Z1 domain-containing protein, partial [Lacipirellulaceae bacterium]
MSKQKLENDTDAIERLHEATIDILRQCKPPVNSTKARPSYRTGLVVGRVQSGKTLSFTSVAAAAHDNGYRLIVVLAGTQKNLAEQTCRRLMADLDIDEYRRPWVMKHNPKQSDVSNIRAVLSAWDDPDELEEERHTYIITVLKHQAHLRRLATVLRELADVMDSPIVIDDEADQAGLNTRVRQGEQSTIYSAILEMRRAMPSHTYLQYTATPQGPLLISLIDLLSPNFASVLRPGQDYVGGEDFFRTTNGVALVRPIPPSEADADAEDVQPPETLHEAMRLFFLGVADFNASQARGNRSMMVHPSRLIGSHDRFYRWVQSAVSDWQELLADESGRQQLLPDFFHCYQSLKATVPQLRPFDELVRRLPKAIARTQVEKVNSDSETNNLTWRQHPSWLLVGGQKLDRGFTVEGLTVTYMPRGVGVGNADTVQQRGRFFGYKRPYLGFCRLFLETGLIDAYRDYVEHERSIHDFLLRAAAQTPSLDLSRVRREILIGKGMHPTRSSIMDPSVERLSKGNNWFRQQGMLSDLSACRKNLELFEAFIEPLQDLFVPDDFGKPGGDRERHRVADVPLKDLYENLLVDFRIPGDQYADDWANAMFLIRNRLEQHPDELAMLARMRPGDGDRARQIKVHADRRASLNPFAGEVPGRDSSRGPQGSIYPGDQKVHRHEVTLQIHVFDLYKN